MNVHHGLLQIIGPREVDLIIIDVTMTKVLPDISQRRTVAQKRSESEAGSYSDVQH
jgi:hypothetical protein